ncbi:MAG TPA: hypothetical protein VIK55_07545 [Paludibacter sp.]
MENHLANTAGIFNNPTASPYWLIYKEIGKAQLNKHIITKNQPMLAITEYLIQSDKCIAVIINMTPNAVTDRLSIKSGWSITKIYYVNHDISNKKT